MRKTIDLTEDNIKTITEYQQRNGFKNFSEAVRNMIRDGGDGACSCGQEQEQGDSVDLITLVKDANRKLDALMMHTAPKSAGKV